MTATGGDGGQARHGAALAEGELVANRYRVRSRVGAGGMGVVFSAFDEHLEEDVALKLLTRALSRRDEARASFRSEVRMARRVSHPNVCRVHDLGEHGGQLFVTMELIRGCTLRSALGTGDVDAARCVDIMVQLSSALTAAHRAGVVHLDVKPDNVLLERDRAVLTDFGIAGVASDLTGVVAGTPGYIAPEVLRGESFDHRADVFACAVVGYELLAGHLPFGVQTLDDARQWAQSAYAVPALTTRTGSSSARRALDEVLAMAMASNPADRHSSADEFGERWAQAVREHDAEPVVPRAGRAALTRTLTPQPATPVATGALAELRTLPGETDVAPRPAPSRVATALEIQFADGGAEPRVAEYVERIVVDMGGTLLRADNAGLSAVFGVPRAPGDEAVRAARAARAAAVVLPELRVGIATDRVALAADGAVAPGKGPAVSRARALAQRADRGDVLLSPETARQLGGRFSLSASTDDEGRRIMALDLADDERSRPGEVMVGRDRELEQLTEQVLHAFERRQARWGSVIAPAGYGKTLLCAELRERLSARREVDWLAARATPLGDVAPLSVLRNADPTWFDAAARAGVHDRPAAFAAARDWLVARATRRPVVIALDDAQWSDGASLAFLAEVALHLEDLPVAVVAFAREPLSGRPWDQGSHFELAGLSDAAAAEIVRRVAPRANDDQVAQIVGRASGHPFFAEELARDFALGDGDRRADELPAALPPTVEAALQARFDRLPADDRAFAHACAIAGHEFWFGAAAAASGTSEVHGEASLARLEAGGIIARIPRSAAAADESDNHERYTFRSQLAREVAYEQVAAPRRAAAHARVAAWIDAEYGPLAQDPTVLAARAQHLDRSGDPAAAQLAYRAAGERSLSLFAYREAASALTRAVELDSTPSPGLLALLGDALMHAESPGSAAATFRRAIDAEPDALRQAELWQKLANTAAVEAKYEQTVDHCRRGLALLEPGGQPLDAATADPRVRARLYGTLGFTLGYELGKNDEGLRYSRTAVDLLEGTEHKLELANALSRLGGNYLRAGLWRERLECNLRVLAIAKERGDVGRALGAHHNLGDNYAYLGAVDESLKHGRKALALCHATQSLTVRPLVDSNLARAWLEKGNAERAKAHADRAFADAARVGARRFLPETYQFAARIAAARDDLQAAEQYVDQGLALNRELGAHPVHEAGLLRIKALIVARADRFEVAFDLLTRAEALAADADPFELACTTAARARVLELSGQADGKREAHALRAQAREVFTRLGAARELELLDDPRQIR